MMATRIGRYMICSSPFLDYVPGEVIEVKAVDFQFSTVIIGPSYTAVDLDLFLSSTKKHKPSPPPSTL
jgi:hypothetical protein